MRNLSIHHTLDCGDTSPLSRGETCLRVSKRSHAYALQTFFAIFCLLAGLTASAVSVRFPVLEMTGSSDDVTINVRAVNNPIIYNGSFYYLPKDGTNLTTSGGTVTNSFIPGEYTMAVVGLSKAWKIYVTNSSDVLNAVDLSREIVRYSGIQTITGTGIQITNDGYGNFWLVDTNGGSGGTSGALTNDETRAVTLGNNLTVSGTANLPTISGANASISSISAVSVSVSGGFTGNGAGITGVAHTAEFLAATNAPTLPSSINATNALVANLTAGSVATGGKVRLIHNGVSTNSFTTITDAKNAAVAGDLIVVSPGVYNENDLTKPGVNIHFENGVTLWHAPSLINPRGIFDDAGGATTNRITGRPNIWWSHSTNGVSITNALGAIIQTNRLTSWTMDLGVIDGTSKATEGGYPHLITMDDGNQSSFDCISILCTPVAESGQILGGMVWRGGEMFVKAINIGSFANYAIWPDEPLAGRTNNMWITADLCEGYIYGSCVTTNFRSWMTFKELKRSSYGFTGSAMAFIGGYQYVTAMKISALDSPIIDLATGAKLWLTAQKITRKGADDESILVRAGTHLVANVAEFEDTVTTDVPVVRNQGTVEMTGGFYSGKAPFFVNAVTTAATATRLSSMQINTSSGTNAAIIASTTNIILNGVVLTSAQTTNAFVVTSGSQTNADVFPARMFCFLNKTNFAAQTYGAGDNPITNFNYSISDGFRVNVGQGIATNSVGGYYRVSATVNLTADASTSAAIHVRFKVNGTPTSLFVSGGGSGLFTTDLLTYIDQKDFSAEEIIFLPANSWLQVVVNSDGAITPSVYNATLCITHL